MTPVSPAEPHHTVESYFGLVASGALAADDRVELLEGVVVAMPPQSALHAGATGMVAEAVRAAIGDRAAVRVQMPLVLPPRSAPEPDVAVVPGRHADYLRAHPTDALLVVEVAGSSLPQDRITKSRVYAAAGIPELWIVNLRDLELEIHRSPDRAAAVYRARSIARPGDRVAIGAVAGAVLEVRDLLPSDRDDAG